MVKYALSVGLNYKNTPNELYGCINDVNNMKTFLQSQLGYTRFTVLTDDDPNMLPTKQNILNAFRSLVSVLKAGDEAFFHYSGHGALIKDVNRDEESGFDSCIIPADHEKSGVISDDAIRSNLVQRIPKGVKLYIVLDACHSGTASDLRYKCEDASYLTNQNKNDKKPLTYVASDWSLRQTMYEFKRYPRISGEVFSVSGCQDVQESMDTFIESEQRAGGVLTSTMLSLFKSNDLKTYKWKHCLKDLTCTIKVNGYAQRPVLTSGNPINMEAPVFSIPSTKIVAPFRKKKANVFKNMTFI
jgi:hypothetical protein